ncbi:MAG: hypothetical protein EBV63_03525 [Actinobacteria bacterium]|jgi:hypothetical protein|nr:hypothetical protein [Actinomycetota bacterium]NCU89756.1 hypothetical protein [Actinomycetota bacterium]NDE54047.1 hypothetical protein [Actinomycetota bacterium]
MALSALAPAFERSRKAVAKKSSQVVLKLVPELRPVPGQQATDRVFYGVVTGILVAGLLGLLSINILLGNDAVRIRELKLEAIAINEEREAALREVAQLSTSEALANRAISLGMVPSGTPTFLDLSQPTEAELAKEVKP